tara:strand:- start:108684 stop:109337 length:654 start_codon:yes stop_codon:yes gene_type:complete
MIQRLTLILLFVSSFSSLAQEQDEDLLRIKERLDTVSAFTADLKLDVDISFINMPQKTATVEFKKGEPMSFSSEDFALIPKRGLDFSFQELFEYPFITVDRGMKTVDGKKLKVVNVIPTDKKADFSIATLFLDLKAKQIAISEISTKKDGTYTLLLDYPDSEAVLPSKVEVQFEMERIRIPLNFMGKEIDVDRKKMRKEEVKTGKIFLTLGYKTISY